MPEVADIVGITAELPPPTEPKRKDKKWRPHPRPKALTKRGPPRPHRRLPEETLASRIQKLTARMERARQQVGLPCFFFCSVAPIVPDCVVVWQHEDARVLLTRYSHEKTYRLREALAPGTSEPPQPSDPPLPEFEPVVSTIEAPEAA